MPLKRETIYRVNQLRTIFALGKFSFSVFTLIYQILNSDIARYASKQEASCDFSENAHIERMKH